MEMFIAHHDKNEHFFTESIGGSYKESLCKDVIVAKYADEYIEDTQDTRRSIRELVEMRAQLGPMVTEKEIIKYEGRASIEKMLAQGHMCVGCKPYTKQ